MESKKINYEKMPIPSGPGAQQITVVGQEIKKGSADMNSKMPEKYVIPAGSSKK